MKDKLYLNRKGKSMKRNLMSLAIISFILGGCTAVNGSKPPEKLTSTTNTIKKDFIEETALQDAVRARDLEQVQFLIDQKSQLNTKDIYGYTPLHIAVRLNEYNITKILIENGAKVNTVDKYQDTPLLDATRDNYTQLSKLLLCNGAKRDVIDQHKMSPLHNSSKNKNLLISEMLQADNLDSYCKSKQNVEKVQPKIEKAVASQKEDTVTNSQDATAFPGLYDALIKEFKDDFKPWNAELTKDDLIFRFNNPVALFEVSKSDLKPGFTDILSDFFPRYLKTIREYKDEIQEIRIEGHTSSEYKTAKTDEQRYELNKALSQKRADKVRDYTITEAAANTDIDQEWLNNTVQAYGMAYDNPIFNPDGTENYDASRRVEFKIVKKEQ